MPETISAEAPAKLEALDKVATRGPWRYDKDQEVTVDGDDEMILDTMDPKDGHFIVAIRNAFPSLAATIHTLMEETEKIDRILERGCDIVRTMHENNPNEPVADNGMTVWDAILVELAQWADSATALRLELRSRQK